MNTTYIPKTAWLAITDICNNKCYWCYEQHNNPPAVKTISMTNVESIADFLHTIEIKKCVIIGGEPTLHPNFFNILSLLKKRNIKTSIVTNGRKFNNLENVKRIKELEIKRLVLSVQGWSNKTYKQFTQSKNGFNQMTKAIVWLQNFDIEFSLNFVLSKYSENRTKEIVEFMKSHNIQRASFNLATPAVSRNNIDGTFLLPLKKYRTHVMDMYYKCKENQINPQFLLSIPHCIFSDEELIELFHGQAIISGCHLLRGNGIIFRTDGSIALCNHLLDFKIDKEHIEKEILRSKTKFIQFWNSQALSEIRKKANCFRSEICIDCPHWIMCGGGCLIHWAYHNPSTVHYRKIDIKRKEVNNDGSTC